MIDFKLLEKYNKQLPRYTSYPPANYFEPNEDQELISKLLVDSNKEEPQNISIYIHVPFCLQLCHFCGCNTHLFTEESPVESYFKALLKEIKLGLSKLDKSRKVSQIHFGGGTPNAVDFKYLKEVVESISEEHQFIENAEIAIECNPAYLDKNQLRELKEIGFNRISLGIQDFHEDVLNAINRKPSQLPHKELVQKLKSLGFKLNLDFVYGLPKQSLEYFQENIKKAIELNPDRLVTFSYAHVPWVKENQKKLEVYDLPEAKLKFEMFMDAYAQMTDAGYQFIGMDHFAKPDDELSVAFQEKKLHRNFQGYCTRQSTGQVYAFGVSAISQLQNAYYQNTYSIKKYISLIQEEKFPIHKIYELNKQEQVTRELINEVMCNKHLNISAFCTEHDIHKESINKLIENNKEELDKFVNDELISFDKDKLQVLEKGGFLLRNIASIFDPALETSEKKFSKTI